VGSKTAAEGSANDLLPQVESGPNNHSGGVQSVHQKEQRGSFTPRGK